MNYAYVTLLSSEDYLPAVLVLNQNLQDLKCKYPLIVMVTDNIIEEVYYKLFRAGIKAQAISTLQYSQETIDYWEKESKTVLNTASKIQIFKLTKFEKVIYLDADSIFLHNPDCLFEKLDGSIYDDGDESGFSGLFVCCPQNHPYDYYECILQHKMALDGDLFGRLWFQFRTNPEYHIDVSWFVHILSMNDTDTKFENINGIHFCYHYKPWNYDSPDKYVEALNKAFPNDSQEIRYKVADLYINKYLLPLKEKYKFLTE